MKLFKSRSRNQFAPRQISSQKEERGWGKRLWLWLLGLLVFTGLVGLGWQYAHATYLTVESVSIIEEVGVEPSVVPVDQLERLSNGLLQTSMLVMDLERLEQDWLSRFPSVARFEMTKHYPNSIEVRYVPRVAYSQLTSPAGTYLVDRGGFVFAEGAYDKIPTLATDEEVSEIGQETSSRGLRLGLKLVEGLRNTDPALEKIVLHGDMLEIKLGKSLVVRVNDERAADATINELQALLAKFKRDEKYPREIDMQYQQPVLRY